MPDDYWKEYGTYLPLEEFLKQNHPEPENSECYIIDAILSVSADRTLQYEISHRLPFIIPEGNEPNGMIFLEDFDDRRAMVHPYYEKLTCEVAKITGGLIDQRYPEPHLKGNYVIRPKNPMKVSDILQWINEYAKIDGIRSIDARVRSR